MRALGPLQALRRSWALFWRRPLALLSLGVALALSLISVAYGLGLFAAPWFLCELFAAQLGGLRGVPPARTRAWLSAGLVQMAAVLVLSAVVALSVLGLSPDVALGAGPARDGALETAFAFGLMALGGGLALALTSCFQLAPAILVDRGGSMTWALRQSARLVAESGRLKHWAVAYGANAVQLSPPVIALALGMRFGSLETAPWWALAVLPVIALGLSLGQGMLVVSYAELAEHVGDPRDARTESRLANAAWALLLLCIAVGPLWVSASLLRPAELEPARAAVREPLVQIEMRPAQTVRAAIPDTALIVNISSERARLRASDGGGAGTLSLPSAAKPRSLAVEAAGGGTYRIVVETSLGAFQTHVDRAGVRLDDSLRDRFASTLSPLAAIVLVLALAFSAWANPRGAAWLVPAALASLWVGYSTLR